MLCCYCWVLPGVRQTLLVLLSVWCGVWCGGVHIGNSKSSCNSVWFLIAGNSRILSVKLHRWIWLFYKRSYCCLLHGWNVKTGKTCNLCYHGIRQLIKFPSNVKFDQNFSHLLEPEWARCLNSEWKARGMECGNTPLYNSSELIKKIKDGDTPETRHSWLFKLLDKLIKVRF